MELRERIVKAALQIFGEVGYEKATIEQIVKRAESSKGGFYHHFQSKKEVLDEITMEYLNEVVEGCNNMMEDTSKDTIYLLNNVFLSVDNFKRKSMSNWKELMNMYSHKDSEPIRQNVWFKFIDITTNIYEKLILRGIDEELFNPSSPNALAVMWCYEMTWLYGQINKVILSGGDKDLYSDFISKTQFVEDTINYALSAGSSVISIKQPAVEYMNMALEALKKAKKESEELKS